MQVGYRHIFSRDALIHFITRQEVELTDMSKTSRGELFYTSSDIYYALGHRRQPRRPLEFYIRLKPSSEDGEATYA